MLIHKAKSAWWSHYGAVCGEKRGEMSSFDADVNCQDCKKPPVEQEPGK